MRTPLKATIAVVIASSVVLAAAVAGGSTPQAPAATRNTGATSGGGSSPGSPGSGGSVAQPPSHRGAPRTEQPCDIEIVDGTGPDASVGFAPCPDDEPPAPAGPQVVEPRPGMDNLYARPFDTATVGDDGRTITIDFVSGIEPCYVLDHVDVGYGPDAVTLTLFEGSAPSAGDVACIDIGVFKRVVITLHESLGDRAIVDGAA